MFQVLSINTDTDKITVRDSVDGSTEEVDKELLQKLETIGVPSQGFSNGDVEDNIERVSDKSDVNLDDIFQNLSEEKVMALYNMFKSQGLSDEEAFNRIYNIDRNSDSESDEEDYGDDDYDEDYDDYEEDEEYDEEEYEEEDGDEEVEDFDEEEKEYEEEDLDEEEEEYEFDEEDFYPEDDESDVEFENFYSRYDEDNARFYGHLTKEQGDAFRSFSRWYTKVAFSSANSLRLKLTTLKGYKAKKTQKLIQLSGADNWEFDGMEVGIRQGDFECSLGHKLKNCYYAINQTKLEKTGETEYIQFGIVCVKDFFDLDENAIKGLNKATSFLMTSKDELCEIYDNGRESEVDKTLAPLKELIKELRSNGKQQWIYDTDYQLLDVYDNIINSGMLLPKPLVYRICNNLAKIGVHEWFEYLVPDYPFKEYEESNSYYRGTAWDGLEQDRTISTRFLGNHLVDAIGLFLRFYFTTKLCGEEYSYDPRYPIPWNVSEDSARYGYSGTTITITDDTKFGKNVYTPKDKVFIAPYGVERGGVSEKAREERFSYMREIKRYGLLSVYEEGLGILQNILKVHKEYIYYCVRLSEFLKNSDDSNSKTYLKKVERVKKVVGNTFYDIDDVKSGISRVLFLKKVEEVNEELRGNGKQAAEEDIGKISKIIEEEDESRWQYLLGSYSQREVRELYNDMVNYSLNMGNDIEPSIIGVYNSERRMYFKKITVFFAKDLGGLYSVPDWVKWARKWYLNSEYDDIPDSIVEEVLNSVREVWCKENNYSNIKEGLQDKRGKLEDEKKQKERIRELQMKRTEELGNIARTSNKTFQLSELGDLQTKLNDIMQNWEVDNPDKYYEFLNADKLAEDITQTVLTSGKVSEKQLKHILKALYTVDEEAHIILPEGGVIEGNSKYSLDDKPQIKEDVEWFIDNKHKDEWKDIIENELGKDKDKLLAICFSIKKWSTVSDKQAKWVERIRTLRETHENK